MRQQVSSSDFLFVGNSSSDRLFRGILIRWKLLTQSEKVVCLGIILIPLWWVIGWSFMLLFWVIGIAVYEVKCYQKIRLERPTISAIALILFSFYRALTYVLNTPEIAPRALLDPFFSWGCGGLLLWYIQSRKIRIRLHVAAWAFSVVICTMLVWWSFFHFVLNEPYFIPPRTLFAILLDKGASYNANQLGSVGNFLVPYYFDERGIGGLLRYTFFFPHPTISSFAIGFTGLIVLDIKKPLWSLPIFIICTFLILIGQSRNAWLALSLVLIVRWLITSSKAGGIIFLLSLMAITSFATLSLPSVTDFITETYTNTVDATSNFRKDSTEVRNNIYLRTWEAFVEDPFLGHGVNGPPVLPGYEFALVGTESFVLGSLLYKSGIVGTSLFLTFFTSLLAWLYKTRKDRPLCCFLMLLYLSLSSLVTEFLIPEVFMVLLCTVLYTSQITNSRILQINN
jgi:hypothetical protein